MKVVGFITEYNPFHYGHKYHLEESMRLSKATHSIAVMSGSFVQRGEPSIVDKWTKAKIAIENGVDLVIELPFLYSTQSAELFALGGIKILDSLNIVDYIAFGSEAGDLEPLNNIVEVLLNEPYEFKKTLKENLSLGLSFASARSIAVKDYLIHSSSKYNYESILKQSNNILAIEYLKALKNLSSSIRPLIISRQGSDYNDEKVSKSYSSATALRKVMLENGVHGIKGFLPDETYNYLEDFFLSHQNFNHLDNYYTIIKYLLLTMDNNHIQEIIDVEKGLDNRIVNKSLSSRNIEELINNISSKRYPKTRIQRILIHLLNNLKKEDIKNLYSKEVPYIRFLGANNKGLELLRKIKSKSDVPIITKFSHHEKLRSDTISQFANFENKATDLYYFGLDSRNTLSNKDYTTSPYIKK